MVNMVSAGGDLVPVGQFYAAMYWGFVISTCFVGISLVQGFIYFTRDNKDRWTMKALIISLLILDPATSLLTAETIYNYFITNFGIVEALERVNVTWIIENGLTVLVTAMVQMFLATRIYLVSNAVDALPLGRTAPALMLIFASLAFIAGAVRTVLSGITLEVSPRVMYQTLVTVEESSALASNLLLSASLCYMLGTPRLDSMKKPETFKTIFMFIVNRAILISILQIGLLSSYLSAKDYLYWMPFHSCKSKLYTNTLLAMLNARGGSYSSHTPPWPPWSVPIIDLATRDSEEMGVRSTFSTSERDRDVEKGTTSKEDVRPQSSLSNLTSSGNNQTEFG